jgi:hypothetical protein
MTNLDIALKVAAKIALEIPDAKEIDGKKVSGWLVSFDATGTEAETALAIFTAIKRKHISSTRRKPRDARQTARALVLNIIAQRGDLRPHAAIIAAFAERNDREFFKMLGRSVKPGRKLIFDNLDWLLLLNWHGWNTASFAHWKSTDKDKILKLPPLKFWTAAALGELIETILRYGKAGKGGRTLEKRRLALGLTLATPAKVLAVMPTRSGSLEIRTAD